MVRARLHLICGNCGNGDSNYFTYKHNILDAACGEPESVSITCDNCGTIHDLNDNAAIRIK